MHAQVAYGIPIAMEISFKWVGFIISDTPVPYHASHINVILNIDVLVEIIFSMIVNNLADGIQIIWCVYVNRLNTSI